MSVVCRRSHISGCLQYEEEGNQYLTEPTNELSECVVYIRAYKDEKGEDKFFAMSNFVTYGFAHTTKVSANFSEIPDLLNLIMNIYEDQTKLSKILADDTQREVLRTTLLNAHSRDIKYYLHKNLRGKKGVSRIDIRGAGDYIWVNPNDVRFKELDNPHEGKMGILETMRLLLDEDAPIELIELCVKIWTNPDDGKLDAGLRRKMNEWFSIKPFERYQKKYMHCKELKDVEGQIQALYKMAEIKHEKENNYEAAIEIYSEIIELNPEGIDVYQERGNAFWYAGKLPEAISDYSKLLKDIGDSPDVEHLFLIYHNRGNILAEIGEYDKAVEDLNHAIYLREEHDLDINYARNGLAFALGGLGEYDRSFKEFELAIKEHPENPWVYLNRALTYERRGQKALAITDYKTALLADKDPPLPRLKRELAKSRIIELKGDM